MPSGGPPVKTGNVRDLAEKLDSRAGCRCLQSRQKGPRARYARVDIETLTSQGIDELDEPLGTLRCVEVTDEDEAHTIALACRTRPVHVGVTAVRYDHDPLRRDTETVSFTGRGTRHDGDRAHPLQEPTVQRASAPRQARVVRTDLVVGDLLAA
jgi:hypothetical protein